jgi:hypothetical protein
MKTILALLLIISSPSFAATKVAALKGALTLNGKELKVGDEVSGGRFDLAAGGTATLEVDGGKLLLKGPASFTPQADRLFLHSGGILAALPRLKSKFKIATPSVVAAVRGTDFYIEVRSNTVTYLCVCEGTIELSGKGVNSKKLPTITGAHHDEPTLLTLQGSRLRMKKAPMNGHTDAEIAALKK